MTVALVHDEQGCEGMNALGALQKSIMRYYFLPLREFTIKGGDSDVDVTFLCQGDLPIA